MRCNGPCVEEACLGEVFAELHGTQFRPRRRVRPHTVHIKDNTLLCFEAFKDFSVPCDVEDFEPTEEMMSFWATLVGSILGGLLRHSLLLCNETQLRLWWKSSGEVQAPPPPTKTVVRS